MFSHGPVDIKQYVGACVRAISISGRVKVSVFTRKVLERKLNITQSFSCRPSHNFRSSYLFIANQNSLTKLLQEFKECSDNTSLATSMYYVP